MNKLYKLVLNMLFGVSLFVVFKMSYVYAASPITGEWQSNVKSGGYWESCPDVFYTQLSSNSISSALNNAVNQWNVAGISCAQTTSPSGAEIRYFGGTRSELNATGNFNYSDNIYGQTSYISVNSAGTTTLNYSETIALNKYKSVYSSTASGHEYTVNTTLHELGLALGWEGHAVSTNLVMYAEPNNITILTNADVNHLKMIYSAVD